MKKITSKWKEGVSILDLLKHSEEIAKVAKLQRAAMRNLAKSRKARR